MFGNVVWWKAKVMSGAFAVVSPDALEVQPLFFNLRRQTTQSVTTCKLKITQTNKTNLNKMC